MTAEHHTPTPDVRIVRGAASEEELAALVAVVGQAYIDESDAATVEDPPVSVWSRTQRAIRSPLRRGIPWGRFSG